MRTAKSDREWSKKLNQPIPQKVFDRNFSLKAVGFINEITYYSKSNIVVTSAWRNNFTLEELKGLFWRQGITSPVIDKTGIGSSRGEEIQDWLTTNNFYGKYAVIDDQVKDIKLHIPANHIIHVNALIGFTDTKLVDRALDILL